MFDQNDRDAFVGDRADQPVEFLGFDGVASSGWFIEQQKGRLSRERARNFQPFHPSIGQRRGRTERIFLKPNPSQDRVGLSACAAIFPAHGWQEQSCRMPVCSCKRRPTMTFSRAVMRVKFCKFWNVRDTPRAASRCGASAVMSSPRSRTRPWFGR